LGGVSLCCIILEFHFERIGHHNPSYLVCFEVCQRMAHTIVMYRRISIEIDSIEQSYFLFG